MSAFDPFAPVAEIEARIRSRLHSVETYDPAARRLLVERDLNPDLQRPSGPFHPAAVLVPLVERPEGLSVLLTRRSDSLRHHSGQIALPGGRADPGETPWETALREAQEEIGLDPALVRVAGLGDTVETMTGYALTPVVGFVTPPFTLQAQESEVADIFETPFAFIMDPLNHEQRSREFGGRERRYYAITHNERVIWGLTAWVLRNLYQRLCLD